MVRNRSIANQNINLNSNISKRGSDYNPIHAVDAPIYADMVRNRSIANQNININKADSAKFPALVRNPINSQSKLKSDIKYFVCMASITTWKAVDAKKDHLTTGNNNSELIDCTCIKKYKVFLHFKCIGKLLLVEHSEKIFFPGVMGEVT